jgi:hypothetical protein
MRRSQLLLQFEHRRALCNYLQGMKVFRAITAGRKRQAGPEGSNPHAEQAVNSSQPCWA